MPFGYSTGSSRPKQTKKSETGRSSASSASHSSNSTVKGPSFFEKGSANSEPRGRSRDTAPKPTTNTRSPPKDKEQNVFNFIEEAEDSEDDSSSDESEKGNGNGPSNIFATQPNSTTQTTGLQLAKNLTTTQRSPMQGYNDASLTDSSVTSQDQDVDYSKKPEAYHPTQKIASLNRAAFPPSPPKSPEENAPHRQKKKSSMKSQAQASGYCLLASRLSRKKEPLPPLYRRFEQLNHRVLLHLQDEIAQMEEELHVLDEYEAVDRLSTAGKEKTKQKPASRRADAQSQSYSTLHYRRSNLMEALIQKTQQYNNALNTYTQTLTTLPRATDPDIKTYRIFMKHHAPIAPTETRFLDHPNDLISLQPRPPSSSSSSSPFTMSTSTDPTALSSSIFPAIIIASTAILLPLLAFSMIHEFSGRMIMVTIVGGAAAAVAGHYSTGVERLVDSRDGWRSATIYFGFMIVAAMFIP